MTVDGGGKCQCAGKSTSVSGQFQKLCCIIFRKTEPTGKAGGIQESLTGLRVQ